MTSRPSRVTYHSYILSYFMETQIILYLFILINQKWPIQINFDPIFIHLTQRQY